MGNKGGNCKIPVIAQIPWHRTPHVRVMVEITQDERVINTPIFRDIIHGYPEDLRCQILTYTLDEIFSEKLHVILQNIKKIHERNWSRSRARDYSLPLMPQDIQGQDQYLISLVHRPRAREP